MILVVRSLLVAGSVWLAALTTGARADEPMPKEVAEVKRQLAAARTRLEQSRERLKLLEETTCQSAVAGRTVIVHRNEMSAQYLPDRYVYKIDGAQIFNSNKLGSGKETEVFNGPIAPGNHKLLVEAHYRGADLLKGSSFVARSTQSFSIKRHQQIWLIVVGFEQGNGMIDPKDRPAIAMQEVENRLQAGQSPAAAPK